MFYRFVKRTFDIICAALGLVISSPIWLIVAIGIKLSSKGPIFYRADRVGKGNKKFVLYKFRSMHMYMPEVKTDGEQREGGYIANANRIFPFGAFLRKSKLDELPQLLNILAGQMSVVGPRPLAEGGVKKHFLGKCFRISSIIVYQKESAAKSVPPLRWRQARVRLTTRPFEKGRSKPYLTKSSVTVRQIPVYLKIKN